MQIRNVGSIQFNTRISQEWCTLVVADGDGSVHDIPATAMRVLFICLFFVLGGCSVNPYKVEIGPQKADISDTERNNYHRLSGRWFGSTPLTDGGHRYWTIIRSIDGRYRVDGRIINNGVINDFTEVGEWGSAGPVYFTIFKGILNEGKFEASDPTDPYNKDAYKILLINQDLFRYQGLSSGTVFEVKRVPLDFEMPSRLPTRSTTE